MICWIHQRLFSVLWQCIARIKRIDLFWFSTFICSWKVKLVDTPSETTACSWERAKLGSSTRWISCYSGIDFRTPLKLWIKWHMWILWLNICCRFDRYVLSIGDWNGEQQYFYTKLVVENGKKTICFTDAQIQKICDEIIVCFVFETRWNL